ncbi:HAD hydrolase-like protein [Salinarimonas rosea]|uniref:HAD hydrolase-like protein n=1 Tax=Salinarimonas rosea TaxID=552063 RepID=UPI0003FA1321|nr:HAD hydrolase-like protein [Salinarimonas rosea]
MTPRTAEAARPIRSGTTVTPPEPPFALAIFDFDGTLADTLPWFFAQLDDLAGRFAIALPRPLDLDAMRGLSAREIMALLRIPAWKLPSIARHVHARAARSEIALFAGVREMLAALHDAGVAVAVVSSNGEAAVRRALGAEEAARVSQFACGAKLFGKARVFRAVARRAGVAPARVICIGDEIRDGEAAREAGLAFGAVAWGYNTPEALARALPEAHRFEEVADIAAALIPDCGVDERITRIAGM